MLSIPFVRTFLTLSLLLHSGLSRPGQCLSGQSRCIDTPIRRISGGRTQDASTQTIEYQTYRGYHIYCPERYRAVHLLLRQVFNGVTRLQLDFDLNPSQPATSSTSSPTSSLTSPAREAFLQRVSLNVIKPLLQKISIGAKLKTPRIPPTIDEDAELRLALPKVPGRPHLVCATPKTARLYGHHSVDIYDYCTKPEFGQPRIYTEFGDTIFFCPRFFEEVRIWQGTDYCPEVSPDGTSFWPEEIRGKPAQEWFDGWQHLILFRELVEMYLGDRALTMRTMPQITEDWNECYELEGDAAKNNPRNWVLWMAAVEQKCTEFPDPGSPVLTEAERMRNRLNTTDLLSTYSNDSYTPPDIFPNSSFLTPSQGSSRSSGPSRTPSNRGSPYRGLPFRGSPSRSSTGSWSPGRNSPASFRLELSPSPEYNNMPPPDDSRAAPAFNYPNVMRQLFISDERLHTIEE